MSRGAQALSLRSVNQSMHRMLTGKHINCMRKVRLKNTF